MKIDGRYKTEKLIDSKQIERRVNELSKEISTYYDSEQDFIVICVLNGSLIFCSDLIKNMNNRIIFDTIRVKSYTKTSRKEIKVVSDLSVDIKGKKVLIIEDIIDTGNTIEFLMEYIIKKKPAEIKIVSFLFKPDVYKLNIDINWTGFNIDDDFVIGYGLDYDEKYRNLDSVYKLIDEKKE